MPSRMRLAQINQSSYFSRCPLVHRPLLSTACHRKRERMEEQELQAPAGKFGASGWFVVLLCMVCLIQTSNADVGQGVLCYTRRTHATILRVNSRTIDLALPGPSDPKLS